MLRVPGVVRRGTYPVLAAAAATAAVIAGAAAPAGAAPVTRWAGAVPMVAAPAVFAWGDNENGQVGDGTVTERDTPVPVTALPAGVRQIVDGQGAFGAALLADGTVEAWGANTDGGLGDNTTTDRHSPVHVVGLTGITQIAAGAGYMLALDSGGNVWSWGFNSAGQLGNGTSGPGTNTDVPAKVPGLTGIVQVAAGDLTSLALRANGTVLAWGSNISGQLGDGTTIDRHSPQQVPGLTAITQLASGDGIDSFAVNSSGTLFGWGLNSEGQLGDGTTTERNSPQQVPDLPKVTKVSASALTTLVIAGTNSTLWGWGLNGFGTIGDGTSTQRLSPRMTTLTGITQISEGFNASAAVQSDGTLLTWGRNVGGGLGNGTPSTNELTPTPVSSLANISQVAIDGGMGLAIGQSAFTTVPDLTGDTTAGASQALQSDGLTLGSVGSVVDNLCNNIGTVLGQNPAAGGSQHIGTAVSITIGARPRHSCP